ncbi:MULTISPECIES: uracil permease [unclassified Halomonas]|uniref:uracil permease n=1 Tax=unclassified Halomonas TaxID=2609666 RepID=UPI0006D9D488|nr:MULTISPECIES: uracil permease [unclassified Halomonas]KPQ26680.1 MAG: putative MFS transporter, AGZA family, xanthine/uracil permease [Halomonas sp. HL-93]SBR48435.1 putative MFS transporter, AGZA family, xanthine/uracil permease [Halomonas sp. HL-93]SNY96281.1 putative MFS transporter, AGZA family, xanthine/uracil permease [Halomonas sp. hl-4]
MATQHYYPWYKKEDTDAFFALFQNNIANFVIIAITMLGMDFPASIVYGQVLPGAAIAVMVGNFYYAWSASRLARKEQRTDVTALSYGISTPVMFVFLFGVLLPAKELTGDVDLAWKVAVAACFISGAIEAAISLIGRWVQYHLPRAAMLGAVAGVALTFIAGEMLFKTLEMPLIGLLVLAIIIVGLIARVSMPFKIPTSLFAIIVGTAMAYMIGDAGGERFSDAFTHLGFYPLLPNLAWWEGLGLLATGMLAILTVVLPITLYNAIETMNNVEAMEAAGDKYDVRECQAVDGVGTMIGALFGGVFPTTVYIATVGAKWMGAGRGYSLLNGAVYAIATMFGLIAMISAIIPVSVVAPILVFVGISMIATAFQANDSRYYPAVALAMLPYFANYVMTRFNRGAEEVVSDISTSIVAAGQGAMFMAIFLGAMTVSVIDHQFRRAAVFALIAAAFSFVGLMHAPELAINAAPNFVLGYIAMALLFSYFAFQETPKSTAG